MRKVVALSVAAALLISLAGCTTSAPSGTCTPSVTEGSASKLITADGGFGSQPTADFPTPLIAKKTQVTVLKEGSGKRLYDGDFVQFYATQFNGETGDLSAPSASYDYPGYNLTVQKDDPIDSIFECVTAGSRLAVAIAGAAKGDPTTVFVIDVQTALNGKATGRNEIAQAGMPSIVTAPNGEPGFTILPVDAPTALKYSTLITGDGKKVKAGDVLFVKFSAVTWEHPSVISSTWDSETGNPVPITLKPYDATNTPLGVAEGVVTALTGQTVGSQVLVVLPPKSYSNGLGTNGTDSNGSPVPIQGPDGSTLVFVYDILGIVSQK